MDIQLRRRHTYIWAFLAVLLPSLVLWAYFSIPEKGNSFFSRTKKTTYPSIVSTHQTADLKINIRRNTKGEYQAEVIVLQPLVGVANQLFLSSAAHAPKQFLLGSLGSRGIYYFSIPGSVNTNSTFFFTVFDGIKNKEVEHFSISNIN